MVRILAIADLHENIDVLRDIESLFDYDLLVLLGDLAELKILELYEVLSRINKEVVMISGNHDCVRCLEKIARKHNNIHYILRGREIIEINGKEITIVGISGIYGRRGESPLYFTDNHLLNLIRRIQDEGWETDIVISHTPPYRCADFLPKGGRGGLKQLITLRDLCKPRYWITGHTHVLAIEERNGTLTVNCGLGYIGDFAIIDTEKDKAMISRLFTVYVDIDENPEWDFVYQIRRTRSFKRLLRDLSMTLS